MKTTTTNENLVNSSNQSQKIKDKWTDILTKGYLCTTCKTIQPQFEIELKVDFTKSRTEDFRKWWDNGKTQKKYKLNIDEMLNQMKYKYLVKCPYCGDTIESVNGKVNSMNSSKNELIIDVDESEI